MAEIAVSMSIGFKINVPDDTIQFLDDCCGKGRGRAWGEELIGNLPPGTNILAGCDVNDCEVEVKGEDY